MKKTRLLIILIVALVLIGIVCIFAPKFKTTEDFEGTIRQACPVYVYSVGETWKAECKLLPGGTCTYNDSHGCEVVAFYDGNKVLYPSMRGEVMEVKVVDNAQYLKIGDINVDRKGSSTN